MNFSEAPEFKKEAKKLAKRWRSIPEDIEAAKLYILPLYEQLAADVVIVEYRREFFAGRKAAILKTSDSAEVIKMRLDVASAGRNDTVRIIFVAIKTTDTITFIELYAKSDKDREDKQRIKEYMI